MNRILRPRPTLLLVTLAITMVACVGVKKPAVATPAVPGASLWVEPTNLSERDLYYGPWGKKSAPQPDAIYTLVERKHTGVNLGMTVKDPEGRQWSVKQPYPGGLEAEGPVEVTVSRLISAVGYHQPPSYYLPAFTLKDDWGKHTETGGRFRLKDETLVDKGDWQWDQNPFVGSKPYQGLIVLLMMFNSTDLKASNNSVYERRLGDRVERWYAVRDIGAAFGDTSKFAPLKNDSAAFERQPFITGVSGGFVEFAYRGWYRNLVRDRIRPDDVAWASQLIGQLSDAQWRDAFRAGGYEPAVADRFITLLRARIEQGRSIAERATK